MKARILEKVYECFSVFCTDMEKEKISVSFNLRGRSAGTFRYKQNAKGQIFDIEIRFNLAIAERHPEEFIERTVPHEVAHALDFLQRGTTDHGKNWKKLCRMLGMKEVSRCHSYELEGIVKGFDYHCACKNYILSTVRHNRILKGTKYTCKQCKTQLERGKI
jgi:SprT protein